MKVFRGQAFETMMLVISVIVAIAILGALLGILGGVGGGFGSDSKDAIKDAIKKLEQRGVGIETKEKVDFNPGSALAEELVGGSAIAANQIEIYCSDSSKICDPATGPVSFTDGSSSYDVKKKASGVLVIKKLSDKVNYVICIGDKEKLSAIVADCKDRTPTN